MASPPLSLWNHREFRKLWAAHSLETLGSLMGALSFTAVLVLEASPQQMALLAASGTAPALIASLPAGVWVDRLPRKPVLVATDIGRAAALIFVPVAYLAGTLRMEQMYAVAFVTGLLDVFFDVAHPSFVPAVVRREDLVEANSKMSASASVVEVGAFTLSGWIAQLGSALALVAANAGTFLASGALILWVRVGERRRSAPPERRPLPREMAEGVGFLLRQPLLRSLSFAYSLRGVSGGIIGGLILVYGVRELGIPPGVLGMIFAVGGISALGGAVAAPRLTRRLGIGPALVVTTFVIGMAALLNPLARGPIAVAAAFLIAVQLAGDWAWTVFEINELSLRQAVTPDRVRGRVNSLVRLLRVGAALVGSLLVVTLVGQVGMRWMLTIAAFLTMLAAGMLALSPVWKVRTTPQDTAE